MSFDHPLLALGALAGLLPVIVHLIDRRKARPQPFAAIDFLLRSRRSTARRLRLKRLLLLACRMAALTALPLALARPHLANAHGGSATAVAAGPAATVFVLDGSGSMRYRLAGESLFERARRLARSKLGELSAEDSIAVALCAPREPPPKTPTFDHGAAREALDRFAPSEEPADLSSCVAAAATALGGARLPRRRIVVFTDGTAADWDLSRPAPKVETARGSLSPEIEVVDAARAELANRSITALSIRRAPEVGEHAYRFDFTVHNGSSQPAANVGVQLSLGQKILARGFCDLSAGGSIHKSLAASFPAGEVALGEVALEPDALPDDDRRGYVLDVPRGSRALLVDGAPSPLRYDDEAYFLATALEAGGSGIETHTVDPDALTPQDVDRADAIFVLNVRSLRPDVVAAIERFVDAGGGLFIALGDRVDPEGLDGSLGKLLPMALRVIKTAAPPPRGGAGQAQSGEAAGLTGRTPAHFAHLDARSTLFAPFGGPSREGLFDVQV
ncbi:MAG: BatA domain-containing protein [Deltaproteobacteria bacterium]